MYSFKLPTLINMIIRYLLITSQYNLRMIKKEPLEPLDCDMAEITHNLSYF